MTNEERFLQAHLTELSERSYSRGTWECSEFLSLSEQSLIPLHSVFQLYGGYDEAERKLAVFGSEELCGYNIDLPITFVHFEPVSARFAEPLTHRDYLGAIMSSGIKRSCLGDLVMDGSSAYVICLDTIAQYLCDSVVSVRRTVVKASVCASIPPNIVPKPVNRVLSVASLRMDVLVSAVWNLSRSTAKELFAKELVFCDGRIVADAGCQANEENIISVRGRGRFQVGEITGRSKKGHLLVSLNIW